MSEDRVIIKRIWDAKIPICLKLAREELASEDNVPCPFYLLAPRISYFPLILDRAVRYFMKYTEPGSSVDKRKRDTKQLEVGVEVAEQTESAATAAPVNSSGDCLPEHIVWLEYASQPMKWHYPIGLLYDLHADKSQLPWQITLHFHNYPTDVLLCAPVNRDAVEVHFMNTLKEADALKHRSQVMNQMRDWDHRQLWTGLLNFQFDQFWAINKRLMEPARDTGSLSSGDLNASGEIKSQEESSDSPKPAKPQHVKGFRLIPCRLYGIGDDRTSGMYIQKRLPPYLNDGTPLSLCSAMQQLLTNTESDNHDNNPVKDYSFLVHGMHLPEETPIQWISEHLAYADNFIHVVATRRV